ncbi:hypothetical protein QF004_000732 [Chryseobacterium sp. MDT2-18]|uniref:Uncharacterized protein n=1 Tax=Chryseobacterium salivictor TaxID=2547600 RepID=A0A4P6ZES6_9FLAO|nr:hypothetical protein [Chryseobacterium sp. MDT2-18]QBO58081.1 hypothetical protein NBC122_01254 [Chryseobacterium salivictor]
MIYLPGLFRETTIDFCMFFYEEDPARHTFPENT